MSICLDTAVGHVTKIINSVQCGLCDKYDGSRLRYSCGHSTCFECAKANDGCLFCITDVSSTEHPILDEPFTQRVKHASQLLQYFNEAFNIDVLKRHKLSTHLKEERKIFPKCIQAKSKYFNKRKSIVNTSIGKRHKTNCTLPGEQIYLPCHKMEQSYKNVQQWLENNERNLKRPIKKVPLADLDVNTFGKRMNRTGSIKKRADVIFEKLNEACWKKSNQTNKNPEYRKNYSSIQNPTIKENISNYVEEKLKLKNERNIYTDNEIIDISDSENVKPVLISDSQSQMNQYDQNVDKDKLAWLAVIEAEKHCKDTESHFDCKELFKCTNKVESLRNNWNKVKEHQVNVVNNKIKKNVPFYKKSFLTERCMYCYDIINKEYDCKKGDNISILIQNKSFTTTINFSKCKSKATFSNKKSAMVQTEFEDSSDILGLVLKTDSHNLYKNENCKTPTEMVLESENLFTTELMDNIPQKSNQTRNCSMNRSNLIINESDSEPEGGASSTLQVTADVHRSELDQYFDMSDFGVLQQIGLNDINMHQPRIRMSPTSTDSSDKENRNPNRPKKIKLKKTIRKTKKLKKN